MNLVATAETAQDVASGLNKFLIPVAESSSEITRLISECFAISSLLRDIAAAIRDPRQYSNYSYISEDLRVAVYSIEYTFDDVHRFCGRIVRRSNSAYRDVWSRIESHFFNESRNSLITRLEYYKTFLENLLTILEEGEPLDWDVYDDHQLRIDALLEVQESRIEEDFSGLSVDGAGASRQRSFERRRPGLPRTSAESHNERRHRPSFSGRDSRARLSRPRTPLSPLDHDSDDWVPSAPDPPRSPTTTTTFSHSSSSSSSNSHWAVKVFEQSRSTTHFSTSGSPSVCYGQDMPGASSRLAENYTKILEVPFENGELVVRLYLRNRDQRGQMHCRTLRSGKSRKQSCLPLSMLRVERVERYASCLKLYRQSSSGNSSESWANLRFSSYEKLVLFFCTFRAMREESRGSAREAEDHELRGETEIFGGKIQNEYGEQALRLFKDHDSDGIRMEASVLRGQFKRKPIWTAFITHHVCSNRWMRKIDSRTIQLAELQRYIFKSNYDARLDSDEQNNLSFVNSSDAKEFWSIVLDLATG